MIRFFQNWRNERHRQAMIRALSLDVAKRKSLVGEPFAKRRAAQKATRG